MTTFKGVLFASIYDDFFARKHSGHYLEFSQNQIIFPDKFKDVRYENSAIKDRAHYTLVVTKNIDMRFRYEITTGGQTFKLWVKKSEEKKLKQVHGLAWYSGLPIKWDLIKMGGTFILGFISSFLLFLINRQTTLQKNEELKARVDNLQTKMMLLEKGLTKRQPHNDTIYSKQTPTFSP